MAIAVAFVVQAEKVEKETYVFNVTADGDTLRLDRYLAKVSAGGDEKQSLIFIFGGGFRFGKRVNDYYTPFFEFMAKNGVETFSIDYRLALSDVWFEDVDTPVKMRDAMIGAVDVAVYDLWAATSFIVEHSKEWGLDTKSIFTCGSSAGAYTSLQSEYYICNGKVPVGALPEGFTYAGVISLAGAICSPDTLSWATLPAPMMMFHGDADWIVPFDDSDIAEGIGGMWGTMSISRSLGDIPHRLHIVHGIGHELSSYPMHDNKGEILDFILSQRVSDSKTRSGRVDEYIPGKTGYKTDYGHEDFRFAIFPKKPH